jgi:hypothetical protein
MKFLIVRAGIQKLNNYRIYITHVFGSLVKIYCAGSSGLLHSDEDFRHLRKTAQV